jgi:biotin synthase
MNGQPVDASSHARIAALGQHVLGGQPIGEADARWLFELTDTADTVDVMAWANRIRAYYKGNRIHLCSIVNAKAGGCSENCKFCAQSAFHQTASPEYGFVDPEPMLQAAQEAERNGVRGFGIVAAWKGLSEGPILDEVCARIEELATKTQVRPDAALGILKSQRVADRLKAAGLECYNHNLESSRRFFPSHCTTHTYDDRLRTIGYLKQAGIKICSGGILGMGETRGDRCDLALALREVDPQFVPVNFLNPIEGTPFAGRPCIPPMEALHMIACFRFVLPRQEIMVAGGRVVNLRDLQPMIFTAGASALMVGNYLTTLNQSVEKDLQMIRDLGLDPQWVDHHAGSNAATDISGAPSADPAPELAVTEA